jgi:hypothetical protein
LLFSRVFVDALPHPITVLFRQPTDRVCRTGVEQRLGDGEFVDLKGATITASSIRDLLNADRLEPRGIRLRDAHVEGVPGLADVRSRRPLVLVDRRAAGPVPLDRACLSSVDLSGLVASGVSVARSTACRSRWRGGRRPRSGHVPVVPLW